MNKRIFVAGLPFSTTDEELKNLFLSIGNVVSASVIKDRDSGRSKGFGFVEMENSEDLEKAIKTLNNTDFGGRKLVVNEARPREDRPRNNSFSPRSRDGFRSGGNSFDRNRRSGGRRGFSSSGGRNSSNRGRFSGKKY